MSNNKRIFLSPPHMGEEEMSFIKEAFATNWIAPLGPNVNHFEDEVARYIGIKSAAALTSGTAAIHLALRLLGVGRGDTVFCSSLTFVASANPILYEQATPVFIDSDFETWNMSPKALEKAFSESSRSGKLPKAVIVVNLYGQSANMKPLLELCDHYKVPVIEDAAESLGATYDHKKSGTFGKFGIFSFNGNKIITTSGGGMLVSDDEEAIERARFLATQARDNARHYQHSHLGFNYRMSNVLAGIGRGQLKVLEERVENKRNIYKRYEEELGHIEGISFMPEASYGQSTRWLTVMTIDPASSNVSRDEIMDELETNNIESRPVWKPLHLQPLFADCDLYTDTNRSSVSEQLFNTGICLPSGSNLTEAEQERVITHIKKLFNK